MGTLGNRAKRLQASIFHPLESERNRIVFHLTALELQREPWENQVMSRNYKCRIVINLGF